MSWHTPTPTRRRSRHYPTLSFYFRSISISWPISVSPCAYTSLHRPDLRQSQMKTKTSSKNRRKQFSSCDACRRSRLSCDASKRGHQAGQVRLNGACSRCSRKGQRCTFEVRKKDWLPRTRQADRSRAPNVVHCAESKPVDREFARSQAFITFNWSYPPRSPVSRGLRDLA